MSEKTTLHADFKQRLYGPGYGSGFLTFWETVEQSCRVSFQWPRMKWKNESTYPEAQIMELERKTCDFPIEQSLSYGSRVPEEIAQRGSKGDTLEQVLVDGLKSVLDAMAKYSGK